MLLQNGVFESLRSAQPDDRLRLNLDCLARGRVATHASLAVCLYSAANAGNYEFSGTLGFFNSQLEQFIKEGRNLLLRNWLFGCADLVTQVRNDLGLA